MGFESSHVARRRLASLAATNNRVQEALSPSAFPGLQAGSAGVTPGLTLGPLADCSGERDREPHREARDGTADRTDRHTGAPASMPSAATAAGGSFGSAASAPSALALQLDELALDIVSTPGAGGALLTAYAAQARALSLILEAANRSRDGALPASVLLAAKAALTAPPQLSGITLF